MFGLSEQLIHFDAARDAAVVRLQGVQCGFIGGGFLPTAVGQHAEHEAVIHGGLLAEDGCFCQLQQCGLHQGFERVAMLQMCHFVCQYHAQRLFRRCFFEQTVHDHDVSAKGGKRVDIWLFTDMDFDLHAFGQLHIFGQLIGQCL